MPYQFHPIYNNSRRSIRWAAQVLLLLPLPGLAQVVPPSLAPNPGQIERQLAPEPQPRAKPGTITIPMPDQTPAPVADDVRFTLSSVRIVGATRISDNALKPLYAPLLGSSIGFNDLNELTRRMNAFYRNAGYLLSQAILPPQAVDNGEVSIRIIEGFVDGFELKGVDPGEFPLIETYAQRITEAKPIDAATLEQNLLLMNDLPGISVRGTLLPAKDNSGAAKLVLAQSPMLVQTHQTGELHRGKFRNMLRKYRQMPLRHAPQQIADLIVQNIGFRGAHLFSGDNGAGRPLQHN